MTMLFSPIAFRGLTLKNRAVVAPMCQYSAKGGLANDWHLVHLGRFALGGFGLTESEAGSDAGATRTTAVLDGDEWVINGSKQFITNSGTPITSFGVSALVSSPVLTKMRWPPATKALMRESLMM